MLRKEIMKKQNTYIVVLVILAIIALAHLGLAITISTTGNWAEVIDSADLQAGAGSDLISDHQSNSDQVSMDVAGTAGNWQLDVKKSDTNWSASLNLYIQRTTDGSGAGSIANGTTYQQVSDTDQNFFNGNGDRTNIKIQLKLSGASVQITPDVYSTTVYYTVYDI
jgi:hypothetical protein